MTTTPDHDPRLDSVHFDPSGLVPVVVQDSLTGEVRMVAYMNREAFALTVSEGTAVFWSRSRQTLWRKGDTSGNTLAVQGIYLDCDGDCVLLHVEPAGPSCHTGSASCFFQVVGGTAWVPGTALPEVEALAATIAARSTAPADTSYTRTLLDGGAVRIGAKLREEADELARAVAEETPARVAAEAADVIYHLLVAITSRAVSWRAVLSELARRRGVSGFVEWASRTPKG